MPTHGSNLVIAPAPGNSWRQTLLFAEPGTKRCLAYLSVGLMLVIGLIDFLLGFELSMLVFYIIPVCMAVVAAGWQFGVLTSVVAVASWLIGDFAAGARFTSWIVSGANALFALATYLVVVWLLHRLIALQRDLEQRVRQRTAALQSLIAERERLEKAILEISERERRSIGHDLHDGLGQHLTGTALAAQVTVEQLRAKGLTDEADAVSKLVVLADEAIDMTRHLAKGLLLAEIRADVLLSALQELATETSDESRIACDFRHDGTSAPSDNTTATHLFHIVKEAVHNAIHHGGAKRITIAFATEAGSPVLTVTDDGAGLPPPEKRGQGLGLSIMAHRAEIIGWHFDVHGQANGGTVATCRPNSSASAHE